MTTIALVDDSLTIRRFVALLLADRYETVEYGTGQEALDGIVASPPDLVLLDITLPDIDGPEVLQGLRADAATASVPVVALTGHSDEGDADRYLAMGFDGFLTKPVTDEDVFYGTIERLLRP